MADYSQLQKLIPFLDAIMKSFYEEMLSHHHIAVFFQDDDHIHHLIDKQKKNFIDSLSDSSEELKHRYIALGSLHYRLRVPSADFLKSTELWKKSFTQSILESSGDVTLVVAVDRYFREVDTYMAEGYLLKQLEVDRDDILKLIERFRGEPELQLSHTLSHLQWLFQILEAISRKDASLAPELEIDKCTVHDIYSDSSEDFTPVFSQDHFNDLHLRLHIDAKSLFYFIERGDYPEVLSLYSSLLSAYKITLLTVGNFNLAQDLRNLKDSLSRADNEIRTLKGVIPICSYCKSIRNEQGVWDKLEKYVSKHSHAEFSHGICTKCLPKIQSKFETDGS